MKLEINSEIVLVDFKYEDSYRTLRKGEKYEYFGSRRNSKSIVVTTCTITLPSGFISSESVKCDLPKHNREFARKYSLKKALARFDKEFRGDVWCEYFEYLNKDKENFIIETQHSKLEVITYPNEIDLKVNNKITNGFDFIGLNKEDTYKLISVLKKQVKLLK